MTFWCCWQVQGAVHGVTMDECQAALQKHQWSILQAINFLKVHLSVLYFWVFSLAAADQLKAHTVMQKSVPLLLITVTLNQLQTIWYLAFCSKFPQVQTKPEHTRNKTNQNKNLSYISYVLKDSWGLLVVSWMEQIKVKLMLMPSTTFGKNQAQTFSRNT